MHLISVACVFSAAIAFFLSFLAVRLNRRAALNWSVAATSFFFGVWALGSGFVFSTSDPVWFWIALRWAFAGYIPIQTLALTMLTVFAGVRGWKAAASVGPVFVITVAELWQSTTGIWIISDYHTTPWGNVGTLTDDPFWLFLDLVKGGAASFIGLVLLAVAWKKNKSRRVRRIVLQLLGLSVVTTLATQFCVSVVWLTWGLPDPTVLVGTLVAVAYFILINRYQHLSEGSPVGQDPMYGTLRERVLVADARGTVVQTSPRMAELWSATEENLRGRPLAEVFTGWPAFAETWAALAADHQPRTELAVPIGAARFLASLTPVPDRFGDLSSVLVRMDPADRLDEAVADHGISAREREVLALVLEGLGTQEIADALFIALATVKNHLHSLYVKTQTANRAELVRLLLTGPVPSA